MASDITRGAFARGAFRFERLRRRQRRQRIAQRFASRFVLGRWRLQRCIDPRRHDVPIVMMSGYVTTGLSSRARDAGVAEVLSKPLVSRDIARSLASALRQ